VTQNHIVHLDSVFVRAATSHSVVAVTSVHFARVSKLHEQPVNVTYRLSFVQTSFGGPPVKFGELEGVKLSFTKK